MTTISVKSEHPCPLEKSSLMPVLVNFLPLEAPTVLISITVDVFCIPVQSVDLIDPMSNQWRQQPGARFVALPGHQGTELSFSQSDPSPGNGSLKATELFQHSIHEPF